MQLALGYWPARAFSAAGELGVYDLLERAGPLDAPAIGDHLGVRSRALVELLDAVVELGVLARTGDRYGLVAGPPDPEILAIADADAFRAWADLPSVLRDGRSVASMYQGLMSDRERLRAFADLMAGVSAPARRAVSELDFGEASTLCDVGGADGRLAIEVAIAQPRLRCTTFDLPPFQPLAAARVDAAGVAEQVSPIGGDFFEDPLPSSDVVVLSLVLLDWDEHEKRALLAACHDALPPGGLLVIVDRLDGDGSDGRRRPTFELLRSLHFLVLLGEAHTFGPAELDRWSADAGFVHVDHRPLDGGLVLVLARRPTE